MDLISPEVVLDEGPATTCFQVAGQGPDGEDYLGLGTRPHLDFQQAPCGVPKLLRVDGLAQDLTGAASKGSIPVCLSGKA